MRLFEGIMNDKVEKYNIPYRVIRSSRRTISGADCPKRRGAGAMPKVDVQCGYPPIRGKQIRLD